MRRVIANIGIGFLIIMAISSLTFAIVTLITYFVTFGGGLSNNANDWSAFGGLVGGIFGPVFSFVTIVIAFITLRIQQKEIRDQQLDADEQKRMVRLSSFESNFFNQLKIFNDSISQIRHNVHGFMGAAFFKRLYDDWCDGFPQCARSNASYCTCIQEQYEKLYRDHGENTGPYFRRLYSILSYIDEQPDSLFSSDNNEALSIKYSYVKIVRSQLSINELKILFYNSLTDYGMNFLPIIERYSFLRGIVTSENSDPKLVGDLEWAKEKGFLTNASWVTEENIAYLERSPHNI